MLKATHSTTLVLVLFWAQETVLSVLLFTWGHPILAAFLGLVALGVGVQIFVATYSVLFGAPYVPMENARVKTMLALSELKPGEKLVDLGSGDGRIVIAAARAGAYAEGWEISPYLWAYSALKIRLLGLGDKAKVHLGSYWPVDFSSANVVTLFLITSQMPRMYEKLQKELKPGSRVVSFVFSFPEWKHEKATEGAYLYKKA